jgi:N-methylhydantoinase B
MIRLEPFQAYGHDLLAEVLSSQADAGARRFYADRFCFPASGFAGGGPGAVGGCQIRRGDEIIKVKTKDDVRLERGDLVVLSSGGGYGDPASRAREAIVFDREQGLVTV